jgi:(2Fe-2S) ferredoxin
MPVVVTAGVHYDNINKNDIENIINETDDMLDEVLGLL